mmetsp:Transcript_20678/g.36741  ORF Transcript_20678/g.36741 Transcript_20678/m.36741 type:complete len:259 (+) Transcript_20678:636-1412(+)
MPSVVRVNKLVAQLGLASRRRADTLISAGRVLVNGTPAVLGQMVPEDASVCLDEVARRQQARLATFAVNKPPSFMSMSGGGGLPGARLAVHLLTKENQHQRCRWHGEPRYLPNLAPAGRLDTESEGLLILTQDGQVASSLIGPNTNIDKEYMVTVSGLSEADDPESIVSLLRHGLSLDGHQLKPADVEWVYTDGDIGQLKFILWEGRKRQIRRMCDQLGLQVTRLVRVRIGGLNLAGMRVGYWRHLTPHHLRQLVQSK